MTVTLASLTHQTGLSVLDHLEQQVTIPVLAGIQAQGDLLVIPLELVADQATVRFRPRWRDVPAEGIEVLRGAAGGNPHALVAEPGTCRWTTTVTDVESLALGAFTCAEPAYLLHPEHGATGFIPGSYLIRRQREFDPRARRVLLVAD